MSTPSNQYELIRSVWNSTTDYLNVRDLISTEKLDEVIYAINNINCCIDPALPQECSGIFDCYVTPPTCTAPYYGTNLTVDQQVYYTSAGTPLYVGDAFVLVTDSNKISVEIDGLNDWEGNYIMNSWEPYQLPYTFRNEINHLVFYTGDTYSAITSIHSDRRKGITRRLEKVYNSLGQPSNEWVDIPESLQHSLLGIGMFENSKGLIEFRIPLQCSNLMSVIIKDEKLTRTSVDSILITLDQIGNTGGFVDLSNTSRPCVSCGGTWNSSPGCNGNVAIQKLLQKDWIVKVAGDKKRFSINGVYS